MPFTAVTESLFSVPSTSAAQGSDSTVPSLLRWDSPAHQSPLRPAPDDWRTLQEGDWLDDRFFSPELQKKTCRIISALDTATTGHSNDLLTDERNYMDDDCFTGELAKSTCRMICDPDWPATRSFLAPTDPPEASGWFEWQLGTVDYVCDSWFSPEDAASTCNMISDFFNPPSDTPAISTAILDDATSLSHYPTSPSPASSEFSVNSLVADFKSRYPPLLPTTHQPTTSPAASTCRTSGHWESHPRGFSAGTSWGVE